MEIFPITFTRAQKIEREAKSRRKADPSLCIQDSLNLVAREYGFLHWHHVCLCRERGRQEPKAQPMTRRMQSILTEAQTRFPAAEATVEAFAKGLVIAVDVADAGRLAATPEYREISDGWYIAAADIWPAVLQGRYVELPNEDDSLRDWKVMDDFTCLRFFHVSAPGHHSLKGALESTIAPVQWCWVGGSATRVTREPWVGQARSRLDRYRHLIDAVSMSFIVNEEPDIADSSAFMFEKKTPLGQLRYQSISVALRTSWGDAKRVSVG